MTVSHIDYVRYPLLGNRGYATRPHLTLFARCPSFKTIIPAKFEDTVSMLQDPAVQVEEGRDNEALHRT